jgi:AcrR family transcriptional regulator
VACTYAAGVAGPTSESTPAPGGKGDRTRRRLLDIAIRRFAAEGYRRTSVSDIAREAGVTPATTYAYFAGKEALFEAAVDTDAASLINRAHERISGDTVRERWLPWIAFLVDELGNHPLASRVLGGGEPDVLPRLLDLPAIGALRAELARDLRKGQTSGEVRRDIDPDAIAMGIETFVLSLLMGYLQAGRGQSPERAAGVIAMFDAALKPPE